MVALLTVTLVEEGINPSGNSSHQPDETPDHHLNWLSGLGKSDGSMYGGTKGDFTTSTLAQVLGVVRQIETRQLLTTEQFRFRNGGGGEGFPGQLLC